MVAGHAVRRSWLSHIKNWFQHAPMGLRENKPRPLIFIHLPRTAGTSLKEMMVDIYGPWHVLELADFMTDEAMRRRLARLHTKAALFRLPGRPVGYVGHMNFGLHTLVPESDVRYVTFMRDPVDRTISHYFHKIQRSQTLHAGRWGEKKNRHTPIEQWIRTGWGVANQQAMMLAGVYSNTSRVTLPDDVIYERAVANIEKHNIIVGLTEQMPRSLAVIGTALNWPPLAPPRVNGVVNRRATADYAPEVREAIREANSLDMRLYDYARQRLDAAAGDRHAAAESIISRQSARAAADPNPRFIKL